MRQTRLSAFWRCLIEKNILPIQIVNIYNEKEDFMYKLFGLDSVDEESEDYWDDIEKNGVE